MKKFRSITKATVLLLVFALLMPLSATANAVGEKPAEPSITAKSAVVMDYDSGELLYAKNPDAMLVPASMTKVMTAYIVYEELARGSFTMDTEVPISDNAANKSRDKANYEMVVPLPYGGTAPVKTLLRLMLIYSASASAIALGEFISGSEPAFVDRMNETARRMGLSATYVNAHGHLFNYITARSQAELVRQFIHDYPEVLEITSEESVVYNDTEYKTTNFLLPGQEYAYEGVDGFKTGTTNPAGFCQVITCVRDGKRLISVVMASSSNDTRAADSVKLLDYGYAVEGYQGKFNDIADHWSRPAVEELYGMGVELHTDGVSFLPDDEITRAEFTAMLYTALDLKGALPDVVNGLPTGPEDTGEGDAAPGDTTEPTDPDVTDPDVTDPDVTDPDVTDPDVTDPDVTDPEPTDPDLTDPDVTDPDVTDPDVTDPDPTDPDVTDLDLTDPDVTDPDVTAPDVADPDVTDPDVTDPDVTETVTPAYSFTDIAGTWAEEYIANAWSRGLVNGRSETAFDPDDSITRQEIMVILDRALDLPDGNGLHFSDTGDIAFWALQSAARVTYAGIFVGSSGVLNPLSHITRAEAAQTIQRIVGSL